VSTIDDCIGVRFWCIDDSGLIDGIRGVPITHRLSDRVVRVLQADRLSGYAASPWSRRSRFFFVMTVASASWLVPALLAYWFIVSR
jgi:hypothetical protein